MGGMDEEHCLAKPNWSKVLSSSHCTDAAHASVKLTSRYVTLKRKNQDVTFAAPPSTQLSFLSIRQEVMCAPGGTGQCADISMQIHTRLVLELHLITTGEKHGLLFSAGCKIAFLLFVSTLSGFRGDQD